MILSARAVLVCLCLAAMVVLDSEHVVLASSPSPGHPSSSSSSKPQHIVPRPSPFLSRYAQGNIIVPNYPLLHHNYHAQMLTASPFFGRYLLNAASTHVPMSSSAVRVVSQDDLDKEDVDDRHPSNSPPQPSFVPLLHSSSLPNISPNLFSEIRHHPSVEIRRDEDIHNDDHDHLIPPESPKIPRRRKSKSPQPEIQQQKLYAESLTKPSDCSICFLDFKHGQLLEDDVHHRHDVVRLPCTHELHQHCLAEINAHEKRVGKEPQCPECRTPIERFLYTEHHLNGLITEVDHPESHKQLEHFPEPSSTYHQVHLLPHTYTSGFGRDFFAFTTSELIGQANVFVQELIPNLIYHHQMKGECEYRVPDTHAVVEKNFGIMVCPRRPFQIRMTPNLVQPIQETIKRSPMLTSLYDFEMFPCANHPDLEFPEIHTALQPQPRSTQFQFTGIALIKVSEKEELSGEKTDGIRKQAKNFWIRIVCIEPVKTQVFPVPQPQPQPQQQPPNSQPSSSSSSSSNGNGSSGGRWFGWFR